MRITLDHNVIIDLAKSSPNISRLKDIITSKQHEVYIVEIGASEMRKLGIQPDRYDLFENLLEEAGIAHLPRLTPMMIWDVTFWDHCLWGDDQMIRRANEIESVLFGKSPKIEKSNQPEHSKQFAAWLNCTCDIHTMWCHLHYGNDIFITSDKNFHKATKAPVLISMGAGKILRPEDL